MKINLLLILFALFCTYFVVLYTSDEEYLQIWIGKLHRLHHITFKELKNKLQISQNVIFVSRIKEQTTSIN